MLVKQISIRMPIIVGIQVYVSMIHFMLGQVEHEIGIFATEPWYCMPFCWKLHLCCLIGLYGMQTGLIHFAVVI